MPSLAITAKRQRERLKTKKSLTNANTDAAWEVKARMEQLIKAFDDAIANADPAMVVHLEHLKGQALAIRSQAEKVIANCRTQDAIAEAEAREGNGVVDFRPRKPWRPGGPDAS